MIFQAKRTQSFGVFLTGACIFILGILFGIPLLTEGAIEKIDLVIGLSISVPVIGMFVWMWLNTKYIVKNNVLIVIWGPFRFKILVEDIKLIRTDQDSWAGIIKPTLSWKCMEIRYGKYGTISVTPIQQDRFIEVLMSINPKIKMK